MTSIPSGQLLVEAHMTNPPKPISFHVVVEKRIVAIIDWQAVKLAHDQYVAMMKIYEDSIP